ncbi:MAG: hypothetical protein F6K14_27520 [Symploca sp. SIO2C1]|nr:hypothetical protein [Symploca sp. SIO2C1]
MGIIDDDDVESATVLPKDDSIGGEPDVKDATTSGMEDNVKSTTILRSEDSFCGKPDVLHGKDSRRKKKKKRKKEAAALKALEENILRIAKRYDKAKKSKDRDSKSKKKKNRWIKDLPKDYRKAISRFMKS